MKASIGLVISAVFVALAMWHFYMASRPFAADSAALPSSGGEPAFVPTKQSTIAVGMILCLCAALVGAASGAIPSTLPGVALKTGSLLLAFGLLARSIGEFRYVGFFKRVHGSRFARMDTLFYSPLCLLLALGIGYIALHDGD